MAAVRPHRNGSNPDLATDGALWVAVWVDGLGNGLRVSRSSDGGASWSPGAPLHPSLIGDGIVEGAPRIATDGAGTWVAVWRSRAGFVSDLRFSRSTDGGTTWTVPAFLDTAGLVDQNAEHSVAGDASGTWIVLWPSTAGAVDMARSTDGGVIWGSRSTLAPGTMPDVAVNGSGTWLAALSLHSPPEYRIQRLRSTDGGATWSGALAIDTPPSTDDLDFFPRIASEGIQGWLVAWSSDNVYDRSTEMDILAARSFDDGVTWQPATPVNTTSVRDEALDTQPAAAVIPGRTVIVWMSRILPDGTAGLDFHPWAARSMPDASCSPSPQAGCRTPTAPRGATLTLRSGAGGGNRVTWKWTRGAATTLVDVGDPSTSTAYAFCIYDGDGAVVGASTRAGVCGGKLCWKPIGIKGFKMQDALAQPDGLRTVQLVAGSAGAASVKVQGQGPDAPLPPLPLALPARVQLQSTNGQCWEVTFSSAAANDTGRFSARSD